MTADEAARQWGVSKQTVINYLSDGLIYGIAVENNALVLPDIPKPKKIRASAKRSSENIYRCHG